MGKDFQSTYIYDYFRQYGCGTCAYALPLLHRDKICQNIPIYMVLSLFVKRLVNLNYEPNYYVTVYLQQIKKVLVSLEINRYASYTKINNIKYIY